MKITYSSKFLRKLKSLEFYLQEEAIEKIELLKDSKNHKSLKVHKLPGSFKGTYSFSVNYKTRIVFEYISKEKIVLLAIGEHDIYK